MENYRTYLSLRIRALRPEPQALKRNAFARYGTSKLVPFPIVPLQFSASDFRRVSF